MSDVILGKNIIDEYSVITVTSNSGIKSRLTDRLVIPVWISTGQTASVAQIDVEFYDKAGVRKEVYVGGFALLNHNIRNLYVQTYNHISTLASAIYDQDTNATSSGEAYTAVDSNLNQKVTRVSFFLNSTLPASQEKYVGEMYLFGDVASPGDPVSYNVNWKSEGTELKLADGSIHRTLVSTPGSNYALMKYDATVQINYITDAQLAKLQILKQSAAPLIWIVESTLTSFEVFQVQWIGAMNYHYTSKYKAAGWTVIFNVKEM